ncbi:MAG TPA: UDP-N-acetylmuramoyl-L-alanine--D-glutamate ligase [Luteimonas sp.]|nr:UDP-N-acetylmuramoyl-L-alanine--D-glutamate ligase [Luteimonas sp.]
MHASQLEGRRVALWGWGREGRAACEAIRRWLPEQPLTVVCSAAEAASVSALGDAAVSVQTEATGALLGTFDIVVKSPGISLLDPAAREAIAAGTAFTGGTALWFARQARPGAVAAGTVCVTGTKGKSTTTALIAHLLRAGGVRTALCGNIGLPLLALPDAPDPPVRVHAIELSSYQTRDVAASGVRPEVAVVTNLFPEHLDWHGGEARYVADKLSLVTDAQPRVAVLDAGDARLAALPLPGVDVRWFNHHQGWHLRGDAVYRAGDRVMDASTLPLPGSHNRSNLCAALAAIDALGFDGPALAPHAAGFQALPHRLQALGVRDGITWVDDSISTTPHATLAALALYRGRQTAVLVGGHDRGLDWEGFAAAMARAAPAYIVTMGQNGPRIHALLAPLAAGGGFDIDAADDLAHAVGLARAHVRDGAVVLLSPGAPSFGAYRDYVERGRHFAALAGFDPDAIGHIAGLGIV